MIIHRSVTYIKTLFNDYKVKHKMYDVTQFKSIHYILVMNGIMYYVMTKEMK